MHCGRYEESKVALKECCVWRARSELCEVAGMGRAHGVDGKTCGSGVRNLDRLVKEWLEQLFGNRQSPQEAVEVFGASMREVENYSHGRWCWWGLLGTGCRWRSERSRDGTKQKSWRWWVRVVAAVVLGDVM